MSDPILPFVRFILACEEATLRPAEQSWTLLNPLTLVATPEEGSFPVRVADLAIFMQLAEGAGDFVLAVECHQAFLDQPKRFVGRSQPQRISLSRELPLWPVETAFAFSMIPFREPGVYEFSVTALLDDTQGTSQDLPGEKAELRIITV